MTPSQNGRYWRDWGRVRKILVELGEFSKEDADAHRHEIHRQALGRDKSHTEFTNRDFDAILKAFRAILVMQDGPGAGESISQPCKRLIWAIDKLGLPEPYLEKISRDQFGTSEWRKLDERELENFRKTATARASGLKRKSS